MTIMLPTSTKLLWHRVINSIHGSGRDGWDAIAGRSTTHQSPGKSVLKAHP